MGVGGPKQYLYVATDGDLFKIGITDDPDVRARTLRVRLVKVWRRPWARKMETSVKNMLAHLCVNRRREWFSITEQEMLSRVTRVVRIEDDDRAIKLGLEPSRRPKAGEAPFEPPSELAWLKNSATR
jgi:hypothetical protein